MFLFLVTFISFIFLHKSLSRDHTRFLPSFTFSSSASSKTTLPAAHLLSNEGRVKEEIHEPPSILDLPELTLECILERLPPAGLVSMAGVCTYLKEKCKSDHLWEKHFNRKWGSLMAPAAHREWLSPLASGKDPAVQGQCDCGAGRRLVMELVSRFCPIPWIVVMCKPCSSQNPMTPPSRSLYFNSVVSRYSDLETGGFCFPAQVYNRENGHAGFILSCYDAEISYNRLTDTFQARYPPHGRRAIVVENGVAWERLRAPPVDASPHDLYFSDCLDELCPGDHIEIQWRRNNEFPYGWWYGVVGHLEPCRGNGNYCCCDDSEWVVVEFNQYAAGSRWRRTTISRRDHREEGNEAGGFYGGLRKLRSSEEISRWKQLRPAQVMQ